MTHRRSRQAEIDDLAFPIRVKLWVPLGGMGKDLTRALDWLNAKVRPGEYAHHPGRSLAADAAAFHFRRLEDAERFLGAFPGFALADGTTSRAYRSPLLPRGRADD